MGFVAIMILAAQVVAAAGDSALADLELDGGRRRGRSTVELGGGVVLLPDYAYRFAAVPGAALTQATATRWGVRAAVTFAPHDSLALVGSFAQWGGSLQDEGNAAVLLTPRWTGLTLGARWHVYDGWQLSPYVTGALGVALVDYNAVEVQQRYNVILNSVSSTLLQVAVGAGVEVEMIGPVALLVEFTGHWTVFRTSHPSTDGDSEDTPSVVPITQGPLASGVMGLVVRL